MTSNPEMAHAYAAAWSSGNPNAVASYFAADGQIAINNGDALKGTDAIVEMAAGFYEAFPDLVVHCDDFRMSGSHAVFVWTLEGHHSETGNYVKQAGWEEWDLNPDGKVLRSRGWFDADSYQAQIDGTA